MAVVLIQDGASHAHFCHLEQMPEAGREGGTVKCGHSQRWEADVRDIAHRTHVGRGALNPALGGEIFPGMLQFLPSRHPRSDVPLVLLGDPCGRPDVAPLGLPCECQHEEA